MSHQLSYDEKYIVSASFDCEIKVWNIDKYEEIKRFRHLDWIWSVAIDKFFKYIVSGSED